MKKGQRPCPECGSRFCAVKSADRCITLNRPRAVSAADEGAPQETAVEAASTEATAAEAASTEAADGATGARRSRPRRPRSTKSK